MQQLQGQVDEVTGIMKQNIALELERGGKLDELDAKADALNEHSRQFQFRSNQIKRTYWWKNFKMWICLIVILLVIIGIIVLIVVLTQNNKK